MNLTTDDELLRDAQQSFVKADTSSVITAALEENERLVAGEEREPTEHEQKLIDLVRNGVGETDISAAIDRLAIATEGLLDNTDIRKFNHKLLKSAVVEACGSVVKMAEKNNRALRYYATTAKKLLGRLKTIEQGLQEHGNDAPASTVFEYGVYKRFFQIGDLPITAFHQYQFALSYQHAVMRYVLQRGLPYQEFVGAKLSAFLENMEFDKPDELGALLLAYVEQLESEWSDVWEKSNIQPDVRFVGRTVEVVTPQETINQFPLRHFTALAPLFDGRYLVASYPKKRDAKDITGIAESARCYSTMIVHDRKSDVKTVDHMDTPEAKAALRSVQDCIKDINNMFLISDQFDKIVERIDSFSDLMKKRLSEIGEHLDFDTVRYVSLYIRLLTQYCETIYNPVVVCAWMSIRSSIMTASIAEHVLTDNKTVMGFTKILSGSEGTKLATLQPGLEEFAELVRIVDLTNKKSY